MQKIDCVRLSCLVCRRSRCDGGRFETEDVEGYLKAIRLIKTVSMFCRELYSIYTSTNVSFALNSACIQTEDPRGALSSAYTA